MSDKQTPAPGDPTEKELSGQVSYNIMSAIRDGQSTMKGANDPYQGLATKPYSVSLKHGLLNGITSMEVASSFFRSAAEHCLTMAAHMRREYEAWENAANKEAKPDAPAPTNGRVADRSPESFLGLK